MIAELGGFALVLALCLAVIQAGLSGFGRWQRSVILIGAGEGAALACFVAVAIAFFALMTAFITSDFSLVNVAANSQIGRAHV